MLLLASFVNSVLEHGCLTAQMGNFDVGHKEHFALLKFAAFLLILPWGREQKCAVLQLISLNLTRFPNERREMFAVFNVISE